MNKKNIYLVLMIIFTLAITGSIFYYFITNNGKLIINTGNGSVKIADIYNNPIETFSNSDIQYKKTADYFFDYYAKGQLFIITLMNPDIKTARLKAEEDFLLTLKISKEQACKLNVQLGVPYSINQAAAGMNYGLSFCPDGQSFN